MKHLFTILSVLCITLVAAAQSTKQVKWAISSKKIADKKYEIHMTATINSGWHMYAQEVGVEGPLPTVFSFTKNPLVTMENKTKEVGKMIKTKEEVWGGIVNYYEKTVDFVQVVTLKGNVKTNLSGKVVFMVCNDRECLPPGEVEINVNVGG